MKMINLYKNYWFNSFNFSGKSSRTDFWIPQLINLLLGIFLNFIISLTPLKNGYSSSNFFMNTLVFFWQFFIPLFIFIPDLSLFFRRFRSIDFKYYSKLAVLYGASVFGNLLIKFLNIFFNIKLILPLSFLSIFFFTVILISYIISLFPSKLKEKYNA